jgi:hypothetical protein
MRKLVLTLTVLRIAAIAVICSPDYLYAQGPAEAAPKLHAYFTVMPWTGGTAEDAMFQVRAGSTVPMFSYSITATKDNSTRTGLMVGTSPYANPLTSATIPAVIVPLEMTIGKTRFDPTTANKCDAEATAVSRFEASPLDAGVTNLTFNGVNVGTTQYVNGFRRAEFWNLIVGSSAYQNTLSPITIAARESVKVPAEDGAIFSSKCTELGLVSNGWVAGYLQNTLIPKLQRKGIIAPTQVVFFLVRNIGQSTSTPPSINTCCILGYHTAQGNPLQTYGIMDWDTTGLFAPETNGAVSSHEMAEWMDDPLGTNATPAWGGIGQVSGCQGNLEVGDPLSGTAMPGYVQGGTTFYMQELAFNSWYFNADGVASLGAGGKFSGKGTFGGPSKACPPGGTN